MTDYIEKIKNIDKKLYTIRGRRLSERASKYILIATTGICIYVGLQLENCFGLRGAAAYHTAGAAAYLTGMLADNISTIKCMKVSNEFYCKHGFRLVRETSPLLPDQPTVKDVIGITKKGAKVGIFEFLLLTVSAIIPPMGLGILTARSLVYPHNSMLAKKVKLTDKLLEERMPNASAEEKKKFLDEILREGDKK